MLYLLSGDYNLEFRGIAVRVHIFRLPKGSMRETRKAKERKALEVQSVELSFAGKIRCRN